MVDKREFSIEGRKDICAERQGVEGRNNLVTS